MVKRGFEGGGTRFNNTTHSFSTLRRARVCPRSNLIHTYQYREHSNITPHRVQPVRPHLRRAISCKFRKSSHPVLAWSTTPSSAITTLIKHPSSSSQKMQQMVSTGLAIALPSGLVIAALNDDPVSIDTNTLAATLHAALAFLNKSRLGDAAAAEKRFAEADEAHAAEVDLIRMRKAHAAEVDLIRMRASRERRSMSLAFRASRLLLAENNAAIQADHARMKKMFDIRDSRDDDVEKIAALTTKVRALNRVNAHLREEMEAFARELDGSVLPRSKQPRPE